MRTRDRDTAFTEYFAARSGVMRSTAFLLCGDWHRAEVLRYWEDLSVEETAAVLRCSPGTLTSR